MIKAVLFDLDGTLIDSEKVVLGAYRYVLAKHGEKFDEKIIRTFIGRTLEDTYSALVPGHDPKLLSVLHRDWQIERKHLLQGFDGLDNFLNELTKTGLMLAAYTSASRKRTDAMIEVTRIDKYINFILCGDEVANPKPHQEGVEIILKKLDVRPAQMVFVGDAEHDILSGKSAGVITIGITHGFGTKKALQDAGADYMVGNLEELQTLIQNINKKYATA